MPSILPITVRFAPVPEQAKYTIQGFIDALNERVSVETQDSLALFSIGSTAPTSNTGPWLKNGVTWYVWKDGIGAYGPEVIEYESLRYIASATAPDQTKYTLWVELDGTGKAVSLKYYSDGAWKSVYEDKFLDYPTHGQVLSMIATAIAAFYPSQLKEYPVRAYKQASAQTITAGAGDTEVVFDVTSYDPNVVFGSNTYGVPDDGVYDVKASVYLSLASGTPTGIDRQIKITVNGSVVSRSVYQVTDDTDGMTIQISDQIQCNQGDRIGVSVSVTSTGASTWDIDNDVTTCKLCVHKVNSFM